MELEQQVVSLDLAKRLKKLGAKQESQFFWWIHNDGSARLITKHETFEAFHAVQNRVSAFTFAEIGEVLPDHLTAEEVGEEPPKGSTNLTIEKFVNGVWSVCYENYEHHRYVPDYTARTSIDAMAKMLVYLLRYEVIPKPKAA